MNFQMSALKSATFLTAASAALWIGSAVAAPLPSVLREQLRDVVCSGDARSGPGGRDR